MALLSSSITNPLTFHSRVELLGESCPIPIPLIPIHGVMAKSTAQLVVKCMAVLQQAAGREVRSAPVLLWAEKPFWHPCLKLKQ